MEHPITQHVLTILHKGSLPLQIALSIFHVMWGARASSLYPSSQGYWRLFRLFYMASEARIYRKTRDLRKIDPCGSPGKNGTFWKSIQRHLIIIFIHSYYRFIASGYWIPSFMLQDLVHETITGYRAATSLKILPSLEIIHLNNACLNSSQSCKRLITRQR